MSHQRSVPPRLSIPRPTLRPQLVGAARPYPVFTPPSRLSSFSPTLTPTPSKRIRSPEGPLWLFTLLHLLSLYFVNRSFSSRVSPLPLAPLSFFAVLGSALFLNFIYRSWNGRSILPSQWVFLLGSGGVLAVSCLLRFEGLRSCGPSETVFSEFAGALAAKVLLNSSNKTSGMARKARGLIALLVGVFFLSQGWARASCSPLAVDVGYRARTNAGNVTKNCVQPWSILAPTMAGFLTISQQSMGARAPLRSLGKRRVYVLSYAVAAFLLLPFAILQLASVSGKSSWELARSSLPLSGIVAFGMVVAFFGNFYAEEKLLMPSHSIKAFQIVACVVCCMELLYALDISLVGFLFCSFVLGAGVQELASLPGQMSWEALGDAEYSNSVYASWIKGPFKHIMSDNKSRKIAIFFLINTGFMLIEFFYGFLSNSLGLISDACHMLFDCAALGIGLYASYISRLPENSKFNYGYGRFEIVSGYANAVLLVLVASLIVLESIERILEPPEISTERLLLVSVGGLLVNLVGLVFFHEEHHHGHGTGGSCSHSHSSHAEKESPHIGLHREVVDDDHSGANVAPLNSGRHSHDHHDVHKLKMPKKSFEMQIVATGDMDKIYACRDAGLPTLQSKDKNEAVDDCTGSLEYSNVNDDSFTSQIGGHQFICAKGGVWKENAHHGHNPNANHSSHADEQINLSVEVEKIREHQNSNFAQHRSHNHDHAEHDSHCHDLVLKHDIDHHSHCDNNIQKHNHDEHDGSCCDHTHNHDHDERHDHCHDHNHKHGRDHEHHDHKHSNQNLSSAPHQHHHHSHMDHNMYGIFLHVLADTLGSVGVVISTILIKYKGWLITDPACSIFLSALIIASVVPLLRNSAEILLQRVPRFNENDLKTAMKDVLMIAGVKNSQRGHVWSFTNTNIVGSLHLQISAGSDKKLIREKVSRLLHDAGVVNLTLQIEEV